MPYDICTYSYVIRSDVCLYDEQKLLTFVNCDRHKQETV